MRVHETALPEVKLIELNVIGDARGFFVERFHAERFAEAGVPTQFVQDNHSRSAPGVLRGLHAQHAPPQGKLVGVTRGRILDVAVDIRPHSPRLGRHVAFELSCENGFLLWIPPGFAHGFCVLGEEPADVLYKVSAAYVPGGECGIRYDDPALGIEWPLASPVLSARDRALPSFAEYLENPPDWSAA